MRALTVRPPWSWAIAHGGKTTENRSRSVRYRGLLAIHGGARSRWDPAGQASPLVRAAWADRARSRPGAHNTIWLLRKDTAWMAFGAVIAVAEVTGCHHCDECMLPPSAVPPSGRTGCSEWAARGQWHIELTGIRPLPDPVPCRGDRGLWNLPEDTERIVLRQLES